MDKLGLDHLLRHAFAGAVFLITVVVAYPQILSTLSMLPHLEGSPLVAVGTGAILLCGSLIYVLHRILFHYTIYPVLVRLTWGKDHPRLMDLDLSRFRRRNKKDSLQHPMSEWASQVHFLYCITWAVLLGMASGIPLFGHLGARAGWRLLAFAVVMFAAAFFRNWHYLIYEREIENREPSRDLT